MIKVAIIDDSAVVRQVLAQQLQGHPDIRLVGSARDPIYGLQLLQQDWPDVIILDLEMPRMDGITFLKKIMAEHPTPVVICSTLTESGASVTMEAMASGAVDIITKPKVGLKTFLEESQARLLTAIRAAARASVGKMRLRGSQGALPVKPKLSADEVLPAGGGTAAARDHRPGSRHRHLDRRHPRPRTGAHRAAAHRARHRRRAAHARTVHLGLRQSP